MSVIQNTQTVGHSDGCARWTVMAESVTTGETSIFSVKLSIPDEGFSYGKNTYISKEYETAAYNVCDGKYGGEQAGNQMTEKPTLSLTFADDYNQAVNSLDPTVSRNIVEAMMNGSSFKFNGDTYIVVGINGVRYIGGSLNSNSDIKYLLFEDGKLLDPNNRNAETGALEKQINTAVTSQKRASMGMLETKYAFSSDKVKGDRMAYVLPNNPNFAEGSGTDFNKLTFDASRYCDLRDINKYLIEGVSYPEDMSTTGTDALYEMEAKMIIEANGASVTAGSFVVGVTYSITSTGTTDFTAIGASNNNVGTIFTATGAGAGDGTAEAVAIPTLAGESGDQVVVISRGLIGLYKHDGTDWGGTPVTSTVAKGCKIFAPKLDTALDGLTAVDKNVYVAVKTAGASGSAVATNWKTKASGSGTDTYVCSVYDWSYADENFIVFTGEE